MSCKKHQPTECQECVKEQIAEKEEELEALKKKLEVNEDANILELQRKVKELMEKNKRGVCPTYVPLPHYPTFTNCRCCSFRSNVDLYFCACNCHMTTSMQIGSIKFVATASGAGYMSIKA